MTMPQHISLWYLLYCYVVVADPEGAESAMGPFRRSKPKPNKRAARESDGRKKKEIGRLKEKKRSKGKERKIERDRGGGGGIQNKNKKHPIASYG